MKLVFATMPRSGSEFLIKLTKLTLGEDLPVVSLTPGRQIESDGAHGKEYIQSREEGKGIEYFQKKEIEYLKLESPGADTLAYELSVHFPSAKWITSLRRIEDIIVSHFNIKKWGWPEEKVLHSYVCDLMCFEYLASLKKLFIVNIDAPKLFSLPKLAAFLGGRLPGKSVNDFIVDWRVINPLARQQQKAGEVMTDKIAPPHLTTLRKRHPWIDDIEARYMALWKPCALTATDGESIARSRANRMSAESVGSNKA